tara:strand:+ start:586 stop:744 length:159 start_codon:yes stop_codon:yes gene_type:complete
MVIWRSFISLWRHYGAVLLTAPLLCGYGGAIRDPARRSGALGGMGSGGSEGG